MLRVVVFNADIDINIYHIKYMLSVKIIVNNEVK